MIFSIEESKEIKAATGNIKMRTIRDLLFSQTLQEVRINNQGAPLLGLTKSIYFNVKMTKFVWKTVFLCYCFIVVLYFLFIKCTSSL